MQSYVNKRIYKLTLFSYVWDKIANLFQEDGSQMLILYLAQKMNNAFQLSGHLLNISSI